MPDDLVTYSANNWGALALDPFGTLMPDDEAWRAAAWGAWWRSGGTENGFARLFPKKKETS